MLLHLVGFWLCSCYVKGDHPNITTCKLPCLRTDSSLFDRRFSAVQSLWLRTTFIPFIYCQKKGASTVILKWPWTPILFSFSCHQCQPFCFWWTVLHEKSTGHFEIKLINQGNISHYKISSDLTQHRNNMKQVNYLKWDTKQHTSNTKLKGNLSPLK